MELKDIKGVGPKVEQILNNSRINNTKDLIEYYPYTFNELVISNINELSDSDKIIISGIIESKPIVNFYNKKMNKMMFRINAQERILNVIIFNRIFLKNNIFPGKNITVIGKYDKKNNSIIASDIKFFILPKNGIIEPIYHSINSISSTKINNFILNAINDEEVVEYVPSYLKEKYHLIDKSRALLEIHKPTSKNNLINAINYLKYEELFMFMLKMNYLKRNKQKNNGIKRDIKYSIVESFINTLPFKLTDNQLECVKTIYDDLNSSNKMNRLLQGDVSSGKTVVAVIALYINYLSGHQGAFMAPTEILAKQHYNSLLNFYRNTDIKIALLTGKLKAKEKKQILSDLIEHKIDIVIGTHALFSNDVTYSSLGLVVTDEQHRFGVNQRGNLNNKGINPDVLYISATPIPRTYAIVLYGDMDISSIHTMPRENRKITTMLKTNKEIKDVLDVVYSELKLHHQIYIVSPLIEESENSDLENINDLKLKFESAFQKIANIGILHGKMTSSEKEEIMDKFKNNEINILISTTVIEVGVDVGNATTMVIFDSFKFGLSALHQLRGRIGRNNLDNYCILISDKETERLKVLTETLDGFKISEADFNIRGGGDIFGVRQSGQIGFNLADEKRDFNILLRAKEDSEIFLNEQENLKLYPITWEILEKSLKID